MAPKKTSIERLRSHIERIEKDARADKEVLRDLRIKLYELQDAQLTPAERELEQLMRKRNRLKKAIKGG